MLALSMVALLAFSVLSPLAAEAVGTGNPVIVSPGSSSALYSGYTGPFVVDFEDAPIATYDYRVLDVPAVGDPAPVTPVKQYVNNGSGLEPQLRVAALPPGDSYRFVIADHDTGTHQATLDFTVRSGSGPKCSLVVPTRVRVDAPLVKVVGRLSSTCKALHTASADWKVTRGGRTYDYYRFAGGSTDAWSVYDSDPVGAYRILPLSARAEDFSDVPQNSPTVVARRDSRLVLSGSRSGAYVTLRTSLRVYSASTNTFRAWAGKYVAVAYRSCSTCPWHQLRTLTTDSAGRAGYRFSSSRSREYRVRASGTSLAWEPLSRYVRL